MTSAELLTATDLGRYCGYDHNATVCPMGAPCWHHRRNAFLASAKDQTPASDVKESVGSDRQTRDAETRRTLDTALALLARGLGGCDCKSTCSCEFRFEADVRAFLAAIQERR